MSDRERLLKGLKTAIIIVLVVFLVSFSALAARVVYVSFFVDRSATAVVPDNIIKEERSYSFSTLSLGAPTRGREATVVELYAGHPEDNESFSVQNMLPGDTVTKYYCVKVYHSGTVNIYFNITNMIHTRSLGEILNIKLTRLDVSEPIVLCDTAFGELEDKSLATRVYDNDEGETVAYFRVEVSLPTSAGNEYQNASLTADFNWYAQNPDPLPDHICESRCEVCGKCLDLDCTEPGCAEKCEGHTVLPDHICENRCEICGKCLDLDCTEPGCAEKCEGHTSDAPLTPKPTDGQLIWPWTILPILSFLALVVLCFIFFVKRKEDDDDGQ